MDLPYALEYYYEGPCDVRLMPRGNHYSEENVNQMLTELAKGPGRIWLIETRWEQYDPEHYARSFCDEYFTRASDLTIPSFARLEMECYDVTGR